MITITSTELLALVASFFWPLTRILGLISVAPLFGNVNVPTQIKLVLGVMLALILAPSIETLPAADLMSVDGILILAQQFIIGAAMGFTVRIVFAAVEMAGEITGMTMGLGFATFYDPVSQGRSSAISQFLALVTLMIYLATNLHLLVLSLLAESFKTLPITGLMVSGNMFQGHCHLGAVVFSVAAFSWHCR